MGKCASDVYSEDYGTNYQEAIRQARIEEAEEGRAAPSREGPDAWRRREDIKRLEAKKEAERALRQK